MWCPIHATPDACSREAIEAWQDSNGVPDWARLRDAGEFLGVQPEPYLVSPDLKARAEAVMARDPKTERIAFLERKKEATKADLLLKFEDGDHHGVADAAMDLRDIESELKGLRF